MPKHVLDDVALSVDGGVIFELDLAMWFGRDDGAGAALSKQGA
jgi:hypothetical protein